MISNINNCNIAENVKIIDPVNLYGCNIKQNTFIGPFVEIQKDVIIGENCRISSHSFICSHVHIDNNTFVGHGVMFTNDLFSDSDNIDSWKPKSTYIGKNVRIGSNVTLLPVSIGDNTIIGAGSVVTKNIPPNSIVCGNPAKIIRNINEYKY